LSNNERSFMMQAIQAGVRPDARTAMETRILRAA